MLTALADTAVTGHQQLVCIDGPSGSGKSTLAAAVASAVPSAVLVHTDDLLAGWDGLRALPGVLVTQVVAPHMAGRAVQHRRYDWHRGHFVAPVRHAPGRLLVLEGVGAGAASIREYADLVVWRDAAPDVRHARAQVRDATTPQWWDHWGEAEQLHHTEHATRDHADLTLQG